MSSYLPPAYGGTIDVTTTSPDDLTLPSNKVRHVVIRGVQVAEKPSPYVLYKIDVLTEQDHWYLFRRYSEFHALHAKLLKRYGSYGVAQDLLPPKKVSGNLSKQHIDNRRQALERYLQKLIVSEPLVAQSAEVLEFLDMPSHDIVKVTDSLARHIFGNEDQLLDQAAPVVLTVNDMYSITRRLKLPMDVQGTSVSDVASDPAHLYSFVHQLKRLVVMLPPPPTSVTTTAFDMSPFRSVEHLIVDSVPITQIGGMIMIQQNLVKLCLSNTLRTVREVLVDAVEEKRVGVPSGSQTTSAELWKLLVTVKLSNTRVVVHPWSCLRTLNLSHNSITYLDESLLLLPSLHELCLDHNAIQVVDLKCLCLPSLETISIAHNCVERIVNDSLLLECVKLLDLSYNRLKTLEGIEAFLSISTLNLGCNLVSLKSDISRLAALKSLQSLTLTGNPITTSSSLRVILLGKIMDVRKSADIPSITLDGQSVTSKEEKKLNSLRESHGSDPELWPLMKNFGLAGSDPLPSSPACTTPSGSHLDLVWGVCSLGDQGRLVPLAHQIGGPTLPQSAGPTSPRHSLSAMSLLSDAAADQVTTTTAESCITDRQLSSATSVGGLDRQRMPNEEETFAVGSVHSLKTALSVRGEPDGQPGVLSLGPSLDATPVRAESEPSYPASVVAPPSTPLVTNGNNRAAITPATIQCALEALAQIANKDAPICGSTPHHHEDAAVGPVFPEAIASALSAWIASQGSVGGTPLVSPPPSTPLEGGGQERGQGGGSISAADLMAALMVLIQPPEGNDGGDDSSGGSSLACSAPHGTPQEGLALGEWLRLGIHPEEVLQALSALTIHRSGEETGDEAGSLAPITEEGCGDGVWSEGSA